MAHQTNKVMNFGQAIESLKAGKTVRREEWKENRFYIWLNKGSSAQLAHIKEVTEPPHLINGINPDLFELGDIGTVDRYPNINFTTSNFSTVTGWVPSQIDMLAEDWCEI